MRELEKLLAERMGSEIDYVRNSRAEASENDLNVRNDRFPDLGLEPITLSQELLEEVTEIVGGYALRCDTAKIPCTSLWRPEKAVMQQPEDKR